MNDLLKMISENQLYAGIGVLIVGGLSGSLLTKIRARFVRLRYNVVINRIGTSTSDPVFGDIKVMHNGIQLRNLYLMNVEVRDDTAKDLSDVTIKAYTGKESVLLSQRTGITGTPYAISWSDAFQKSIEVPSGTSPTQSQWSIYNTSREYHLEVFKRYSKLEFSFLCTSPTSDTAPDIWLATPTIGVTMKRVRHYLFSNGTIFGVPFAKTLPFGLLISVVAVVCLSLIGLPTLANSMIGLFLGMSITLVGSVGYRVYDFFRKWIGS